MTELDVLNLRKRSREDNDTSKEELEQKKKKTDLEIGIYSLIHWLLQPMK